MRERESIIITRLAYCSCCWRRVKKLLPFITTSPSWTCKSWNRVTNNLPGRSWVGVVAPAAAAAAARYWSWLMRKGPPAAAAAAAAAAAPGGNPPFPGRPDRAVRERKKEGDNLRLCWGLEKQKNKQRQWQLKSEIPHFTSRKQQWLAGRRWLLCKSVVSQTQELFFFSLSTSFTDDEGRLGQTSPTPPSTLGR